MGLPQLSFTTIYRSKCCNGQYIINKSMCLVWHTTLNLLLENSRESIQQMLNHIFNAQDFFNNITECGCGQECTDDVAIKMALVVDQMPPVMAVLFGTDIKRKKEK